MQPEREREELSGIRKTGEGEPGPKNPTFTTRKIKGL